MRRSRSSRRRPGLAKLRSAVTPQCGPDERRHHDTEGSRRFDLLVILVQNWRTLEHVLLRCRVRQEDGPLPSAGRPRARREHASHKALQTPTSRDGTARPGLQKQPTSFFGWGRPLPKNLRRVERNGKTVAWDIVFRVVRPERDRYLGVDVVWDQVPGTHSSYGDMSWGFHVKTS